MGLDNKYIVNTLFFSNNIEYVCKRAAVIYVDGKWSTMVTSCIADNCNKRQGELCNGKAVQLHSFPISAERIKQWKIALNKRDDWVPYAASKVCGCHFIAGTCLLCSHLWSCLCPHFVILHMWKEAYVYTWWDTDYQGLPRVSWCTSQLSGAQCTSHKSTHTQTGLILIPQLLTQDLKRRFCTI